MPLSFSFELHPALCAVSDRLLPTERWCAFLDDQCVICNPTRSPTSIVFSTKSGGSTLGTQVHHGKAQVWNAGGVPPSGWDVMIAAAPATVRRGDRPDFVQAQLRLVTESHKGLFGREPVCFQSSGRLALVVALHRDLNKLPSACDSSRHHGGVRSGTRWRCTRFCKRSCGVTHASGFTMEKPSFGTRVDLSRPGLRNSPLQRAWWNPTHGVEE